MLIFCLGFMGFASVTFWISLYMQELKHLSALLVAVQLLPMVVSGTLVNVVCGFVLHKISNKLLMGIGAVGYTAALLTLSFLREDAPYWAFIFPGLILVVVGADIEFNVVNVSCIISSLVFRFVLADRSRNTDVCNVFSPIIGTIRRRWDLQHYLQTL